MCHVLCCSVVKEEVTSDEASLPCVNGRVVAWVRAFAADSVCVPCACQTRGDETNQTLNTKCSKTATTMSKYVVFYATSRRRAATFSEAKHEVNN